MTISIKKLLEKNVQKYQKLLYGRQKLWLQDNRKSYIFTLAALPFVASLTTPRALLVGPHDVALGVCRRCGLVVGRGELVEVVNHLLYLWGLF